ncbi:phosphoadenosine phosphosulfate reductase domain-containing protein [Paenibacillus sp. Leaf72]|uniref:phosphoadenosine phosphosulfate reductase domain-containing protein n=1 Tax=Paenibacillus sp. Leaf72 TaxID=1736234 RepID=UPI0006FC4A49|nr:phosphoadenosine phosphosulfate reductase family protein [Paenibacillus sp. Leaf72]KQN96801.1 hypothetical protein ASF12_22270 [Paenibacillus sp. Leaf72]
MLKDDQDDIEESTIESSHYQFIQVDNKISPEANLKKHNNRTRKIWKHLQSKGWFYYGVVRKWTAVFRCDTHYVAVHHFITDQPKDEMIGAPELAFNWKELLLSESNLQVASLLYGLENHFGMSVTIPQQAFTDAFKQEVLSGKVSQSLFSPKHKLMIWCKSDEFCLLLEVYIGQKQISPYGVKEPFEWPDLTQKTEYIKQSIFDFDVSMDPINSDQHNSGNQEYMGIEDKVPDEVLEVSRQAIRKMFEENEKVICAYSGGKDSTVIVQMCVEFALENPEYQDKLHIISASTGVENPIIEQHVRRMKDVILRTLNQRFKNGFGEERYVIVEPLIEDNFVTCIFGKSFSPPTQSFRWCISRLKVGPARTDLMRFSDEEIIVQALGVRSSESSNRTRSINHHFGDDFYGVHVIRCIRTAPPIRHWSATDVATFLARHPSPWTEEYSNYQLINIYGFAAGMMECPIGAMITNDNDAIKSCSGSAARFGCWSCTVVKEDISLKNLVEAYPEELSHLYEMRNILKSAQDIRYGGFTGYKRSRKAGTFQPGYGDLTIDMRTILLNHWSRLGVPMKEEEILAITKLVRQREIKEGLAIPDRFWEALFQLLPITPGPFTSSLFHPVWEPDYLVDNDGTKIKSKSVGIDRMTENDNIWIKRFEGVSRVAATLKVGQSVRILTEMTSFYGECTEIIRNEFGHIQQLSLNISGESVTISLAFIHDIEAVTFKDKLIEGRQLVLDI